MARISWREITQRFSHIDARAVRCQLGLPSSDSFYTVAFYPWWEHPLYLKAREEGTGWGFANSSDGEAEVTVYPKNVRQFQISELGSVIDWGFTQTHPFLWQYEAQGKVICNSPLTLEQWMKIATLTQENLAGPARHADVAEYALKQVYQWGRTGSFCLGSFPLPLLQALLPVLDAQEVRYFLPFEPKPTPMPVLFLIDGEDYIIADDFEVDVPEFQHKPEWFYPRADDKQ